MASGLLGALWLLGLFAAAPALRTGQRYTLPDRIRDAIVLGVAIPLVLGFVHALYPPLCWLALALCIALAYLRTHVILPPSTARVAHAPLRTGSTPEGRAVEGRPPYFLIAALALVAWPPLMRPLLDGDSLSYHLPNAAAWVHAHSVWTTDGRYWWYPPASESFATGVFAVSGAFALGWSGFAVLALLGFRIVQWSYDEFGAPPWLADALTAAAVTMTPLALQAGSLQNDVWLAAFFLEALCALRSGPSAAARTIAVTALLKPYGWAFALLAAILTKAPLRVWIAGAAAIALWIVHDAFLWNGAIVAPASASSGNTWQSTILAHGLSALALLVRVSLLASPLALPALFAALFGPLFAGSRQRAIGWGALAAALAFLVMPLAFADSHAQLASGQSLRYAAPALALGALLLARPLRGAPVIAAALLVVCAGFGCFSILSIYWNDAGTHIALIVGALAVANVAMAYASGARWAIPAGLAIAIVYASSRAAQHPVDYYSDGLRVYGKATGVYAWLTQTQPPGVGGWGLRLGIVNVLAPAARTLDLPDATACLTAAREHVLLVAIAENDRPPPFSAARLTVARACAVRVRYDDGIAVASEPMPEERRDR